MKNIKWPEVTVAIPAKNDAEGLRACLTSIRKQDYDRKLIDLIIIDDRSTDNTISIARQHGARIFRNEYEGRKIINRSEVGKKIGLQNAKGQYIYILEQDIEIRGTTFFKNLLKPLVVDKTLAASFTREGVVNKSMTWPTRFISYHPAQCDPVYEYFTPSLETTFIESKKGYFICKFPPQNFPPFGRMMFRIQAIQKTPISKWPGFFDLDSVATLIKSGQNRFAYVPEPGIYHYHAKTFSNLIFKRVRNLDNHFFPYQSQAQFQWFDTSSKAGVLKILIWIIYANLLIPATFKGIFKALKHKDAILLMEPVVAITTTDVLLWHFITTSNGRRLITKSLRSLLS